MDCKDFKNTVADLFDKEVAPNVKAACEKHISQCAECREYYEELLTTAELLRPRHSPVLKREKITANARKTTTFYKVAAMLVGAIFLSGIAYATIRVLSPMKTVESTKEQKMLRAHFVPENCKQKFVIERGDEIIVNWTEGTWIQDGEDSFIEEHPTNVYGYAFPVKTSTVMLDGQKLDIHNLPKLPASALKKMEIERGEDRLIVNLYTMLEEAPINVKGNINPELTILLTGKPPKDAIIRSSIYTKKGIHDNFNWKDYLYTSWTSEIENIEMLLEEVAIRKDHHVRVNVCRGVSQEHISRLKKLMQENGVTNYEFINQK
ncbi:MAG: hypothetical protein IKX17_02430 [Prevotella sp.]|nr:hypothetical protein [Prevotella sp.]